MLCMKENSGMIFNLSIIAWKSCSQILVVVIQKQTTQPFHTVRKSLFPPSLLYKINSCCSSSYLAWNIVFFFPHMYYSSKKLQKFRCQFLIFESVINIFWQSMPFEQKTTHTPVPLTPLPPSQPATKPHITIQVADNKYKLFWMLKRSLSTNSFYIDVASVARQVENSVMLLSKESNHDISECSPIFCISQACM